MVKSNPRMETHVEAMEKTIFETRTLLEATRKSLLDARHCGTRS